MLYTRRSVTKEAQITIRLEPELIARFDRMVAKLAGAATRASLVRLAMLHGLPALEERYEDLSDAPLTPVGKQPSKRRRSDR